LNEISKSADNEELTVRRSFRYIKKDTLLYIVMVVVLIVFAGTREYVGIDYVSYFKEYERFKLSNIDFASIFGSISETYKQEPTLYLIYWLCNSFNAVIFIFACISLIPKAFLMKKYLAYPAVGIFIYFMDFFLGCDMGLVRQCAAMSVVMLSFVHIKNKNLKAFVVCIIIAFLFHRSALLFAPAYLVNVIKISPKKAAVIVTFSLIFVRIDLTRIINNVLVFMPDVLLGKYASRVFETQELNFGITTFYRIILFWIFSYFVDLINKNKEIDDSQEQVINLSYKILFLGTCFFYIFRSIYSISGRGMYYYFMFEALLTPALLSTIKTSKLRLQYFLVFIALYSVLFFATLYNYSSLTYNGYSAPYMPYESFLF
jgi:hypothetical protein